MPNAYKGIGIIAIVAGLLFILICGFAIKGCLSLAHSEETFTVSGSLFDGNYKTTKEEKSDIKVQICDDKKCDEVKK